MVVRITKPRHRDRPPTMTCVREDGSTTGQPSTGFFVRHDLTHFAVESVLGFKEAFFGLLASGWDISAFEEREPGSRKSRKLPDEAIVAETIVGALDLDRSTQMTASEMAQYVAGQLASMGLDGQAPSHGEIERIRAKRNELLVAWGNLEAGSPMQLTWD